MSKRDSARSSWGPQRVPEAHLGLKWTPEELALMSSVLGEQLETHRFSAKVGANGEWHLTLRLRLAANGLVCDGLEIVPTDADSTSHPQAITSSLLHSIRIPQLLADAVAAWSAEPSFVGTWYAQHVKPKPSRAPARAPGPKGHGDDFYQSIAEQYLAALRIEPHRPIAWMAKQVKGASRDNVRDWVAEARRRGFLTPGQQGKAGGLAGPRLREGSSGPVAQHPAMSDRPSPEGTAE
jgi:hypothetical protein